MRRLAGARVLLLIVLSAMSVGCLDIGDTESSAQGTGGSGGISSGGGGWPGDGSSNGGSAGNGGSANTGGSGGSGGVAGSDASRGLPRIVFDTSMGTMTVELDDVQMPITTSNFLAYVDAGFFDGTIIHRVIPDFVIQGGGYGPGLSKKATQPPITLEISPEILHDYGVISMARTSEPNSATSQFFLVNAPNGAHSLDGQYAAFGKLVEGNATLDAISQVQTQSISGFENVPVTDVVINSVTRL
jgi:cyclophilin family peptidyl-prolyl cis-trans isomerase